MTALAGLAVVHGGAFLAVWELPYVSDHLTYRDVGRKLDNVFHIGQKIDSLRDKREARRRENEEIFTERRKAR